MRLNRIEDLATGPTLSVVGSTTLEWWKIPHFTEWELADEPLKTVPFGSVIFYSFSDENGENREMARQVRIEFEGAMYHVMARGDRREAIVRDDEDRRTFLRTLREVCKRAGFRLHAHVLMTNHYHLLIETPEGNLSRGMGWLQNAFTRRINTMHRLWRHVFGGRYKSVLVEPGNCLGALLDYIHLNPVCEPKW